MTYVTAADSVERKLFGGFEFRFQGFEIGHSNLPALDFEHSFRLKAGEVSGNQLANRANLRRQFLVVGGQRDLNTVLGTLS